MLCPPIPSQTEVRRHHATIAAAAVFWLGVVSGSPAARAQAPDAAATDRGRELYKAGEEAFKAGRYDDAYREWDEGYKLSGRPRFLLNMAHAERRRGELGRASALYKKYLLTDPETKVRADIEAVIAEIDVALAAEASAGAARANHPSDQTTRHRCLAKPARPYRTSPHCPRLPHWRPEPWAMPCSRKGRPLCRPPHRCTESGGSGRAWGGPPSRSGPPRLCWCATMAT